MNMEVIEYLISNFVFMIMLPFGGSPEPFDIFDYEPDQACYEADVESGAAASYPVAPSRPPSPALSNEQDLSGFEWEEDYVEVEVEK